MTDLLPGSPEAKRNGCLCDPKANQDGRGIATIGSIVRYAVRSACPLHGVSSEPATVKDDATRDLFGDAT